MAASPTGRARCTTRNVSASLTGVHALTLVVGAASDGTCSEQADWAEPLLTCSYIPDGPWPHSLRRRRRSPHDAIGTPRNSNDDATVARAATGRVTGSHSARIKSGSSDVDADIFRLFHWGFRYR